MTLRILTSLLDAAFDEAVVRRLSRADAGAEVVRRCVDVVAVRSAAGSGEVDVVVVDVRLRGLDRDVVAELHAHGVRVVAVAASLEGAHQMGADIVVESDVEAVLTALRGGLSGSAIRSATENITPGGQVMVVWGPIGAPGRTTVAIGVADELSRLGVVTALVDADTYGPSVAPQLGLLEDSSGVAAACRTAAVGKLDVDAWRRVCVTLPSGLSVLTGLSHSQGWAELRPAALDTTLNIAREVAAVTVVDAGFCVEHDPLTWFEPGTPSRNQATVAALGAADIVLAVTGSDPVSLVRFIHSIPDVRSLAPTAGFHTVVNAVPRGYQRERETRHLLGPYIEHEPLTCLPHDADSTAAARAVGRTLAEVAPRSSLRQQIRALAGHLVGVPVPKGRRRAA